MLFFRKLAGDGRFDAGRTSLSANRSPADARQLPPESAPRPANLSRAPYVDYPYVDYPYVAYPYVDYIVPPGLARARPNQVEL